MIPNICFRTKSIKTRTRYDLFNLVLVYCTYSYTEPSVPTILTRHTKSTRKWDAFALKITKWAFISLKIPTAIGSKFHRKLDVDMMLND